ncbi:hypothetical protein ALC62_04718 [Cyphomyrmex costatus]|uniref:Uncharacterized protein n=1 Tax=Cyphomyrmex costatus TaxID=456900 RepID=A0A195CUY9_9HYME|nr:hypothetical protein ALC62_04718 [Cyphomyrmex costatus]
MARIGDCNCRNVDPCANGRAFPGEQISAPYSSSSSIPRLAINWTSGRRCKKLDKRRPRIPRGGCVPHERAETPWRINFACSSDEPAATRPIVGDAMYIRGVRSQMAYAIGPFPLKGNFDTIPMNSKQIAIEVIIIFTNNSVSRQIDLLRGTSTTISSNKNQLYFSNEIHSCMWGNPICRIYCVYRYTRGKRNPLSDEFAKKTGDWLLHNPFSLMVKAAQLRLYRFRYSTRNLEIPLTRVVQSSYSEQFVRRERTDIRAQESEHLASGCALPDSYYPFHAPLLTDWSPTCLLCQELKCRSTVIKETSGQRPDPKSIFGVNEGSVTATSFEPDFASQGKLDRLIRIDWST